MKEFLKDYGTLVGSFLGFTFAVLAMFVKNLYDKRTSLTTLNDKIRKLKKMLEEVDSPQWLNHYDVENTMKQSERKFLQSMNTTLNLDFIETSKSQLEIPLNFIDKLEDEVLKYHPNDKIKVYYEVKNKVNGLKRLMSETIDEIKSKSEIHNKVAGLDYEEDFEGTVIMYNSFIETEYKELTTVVEKL